MLAAAPAPKSASPKAAALTSFSTATARRMPLLIRSVPACGIAGHIIRRIPDAARLAVNLAAGAYADPFKGGERAQKRLNSFHQSCAA